MTSKNTKLFDPDVHFRLPHLLEENPLLTQRELAEKLGINLGRINFCLKALIEIGHIKIGNFRKNPNRSVYWYLLTPRGGLEEKAKLTAGLLKRKMAEYQALKKEIDAIKSKVIG